MEHKIRFVDDEVLLVAGQQLDWALCSLLADGVTLCIRRSVRTMSDEDAEAVLEAAWQGFREIAERRPEVLAS